MIYVKACENEDYNLIIFMSFVKVQIWFVIKLNKTRYLFVKTHLSENSSEMFSILSKLHLTLIVIN